MRKKFVIPLLVMGCTAFGAQVHENPFAVKADLDEPITYHNPVLPGFYSDPSVCRVGDDYYLVAQDCDM